MRSLVLSAATRLVAAGLATGVLVAGCVIFTGGSSGYTENDGGSDAAVFAFSCTSNDTCTDAGPDPVCCFGVSGTSLGSFCSATACSLGQQQLCSTSAECADGIECIKQSCLGSVPFSACGIVAFSPGTVGPVTSCVPVDAGTGTDAATGKQSDAAVDARADAATEAGMDASSLDAAASDADGDAGANASP